jgi:hypothetical protein
MANVTLDPDQHQALELLAGWPQGLNEARMTALGFTVEMLTGPVRAGKPLPA